MLIFLKTLALDNEAHIDADITRERERERAGSVDRKESDARSTWKH